MLNEASSIIAWNQFAKQKAQFVIQARHVAETEITSAIQAVNHHSEKLNQYVYDETRKLLAENKLVA